jgi:TPR repeat protein
MLPAALILLVAVSGAGADFGTAMEAYGAGDFETAYSLWLPLAEAGNAAAQFNIGLLNERGEGRDRDIAEALAWYAKAAESGFARAQFRLGEIYDAGKDVERDLIEARKWFFVAAEARYPKARKRMKKVADEMTPKEIALGDMWGRVLLQKLKGD